MSTARDNAHLAYMLHHERGTAEAKRRWGSTGFCVLNFHAENGAVVNVGRLDPGGQRVPYGVGLTVDEAFECADYIAALQTEQREWPRP